MFTKGNKLGKGRPRISLSKPELLLPAVFIKGNVNWANDFVELYKAMKKRDLTALEQRTLKLLLDIMPYLCTKVQLKELQATSGTPADSVAQAKQTSKLLQALEAENGSRPSSTSESNP